MIIHLIYKGKNFLEDLERALIAQDTRTSGLKPESLGSIVSGTFSMGKQNKMSSNTKGEC